MIESLRLLLEVGPKRTFACALDWTGLARSGRTEADAIEAVRAALVRFEVVAREAGEPFDPARLAAAPVEVVERVPGNATTDFGAPGVPGEADAAPLTAEQAAREARLLAAAWAVFDRVAAAAPAELRKGPRGGGRDTAKVVEHVRGAEEGYAGAIGIPGAARLSVLELRARMLEEIGKASDGRPMAGKRWPPRYAARRLAWHVVDHLWEIEDRSGPG